MKYAKFIILILLVFLVYQFNLTKPLQENIILEKEEVINEAHLPTVENSDKKEINVIEAINEKALSPELKTNLDEAILIEPKNEPENINLPFEEITDYQGIFKLDLKSVTKLKAGDTITLEHQDKAFKITLNSISHDTPNTEYYSFTGEDGSDNFYIHHPATGEGYLSIYTPELAFESALDSNGNGEYHNVHKYIENGWIDPEFCIVIEDE